ncbi:MAG TPA: mechanosensitive ion channel domain-containing protein [Bryobacteraceae bacterium]|jgi:small-conductance mechanosensitive channel
MFTKYSRSLRSVVFLLVCCACAQQNPQTNADHKTTANVTVGDQILFPIRTRLGPFSPENRAKAASTKLERLMKDVSISSDAITVDEHETSTDVVAGEVIIMTVTEPDAAAAGLSRSTLANNNARQMRAALTQVRSEYTYKSLMKGALYAALATLVLISVLIAFRFFFPKLYGAIERRRGTSIRTVKIQSLELLSAARITDTLIRCARLARFGVTILLFYFYVPLVFSFFPWTRTFGSTLLAYVLTPIGNGWNAFVSYLPSLLVVLVVVIFSYFAIRAVRFVFTEIERGTISWPGFYPEWAMPTYKIVQLLILAFALVVMFPYLPGSDSPAFKGISIFLGVLFSLGSSSAVANVIAGVILTYTRAFKHGDRVQIADTVGDVMGKTLLATHVKTIKNVYITIPNSLVLGSHIINFSASAQGQPLILHTGVTIGYDAPWRQIHALLIAAAAATPGVLPEPKPFVLQSSLDDFYVAYEINAYTDQPSRMALIYSDLHQNIQDKFNEAGVEIMSPHYHAVRDGNVTAIPENYLPPDYVPAAFRLFRTAPAAKTGE